MKNNEEIERIKKQIIDDLRKIEDTEFLKLLYEFTKSALNLISFKK